MAHHFRGDTRPRYKPGDRGGGSRGRGDMGRKHNRDVREWSFVYSRKFWIGWCSCIDTFPNGYQIKHERSDGQDSCWAPQNAPAPFHPVSRRGQSQQPGMSGSWPVPMPRHQSAYSYQGVPTEPRAMASAHPPSHLVTCTLLDEWSVAFWTDELVRPQRRHNKQQTRGILLVRTAKMELEVRSALLRRRGWGIRWRSCGG